MLLRPLLFTICTIFSCSLFAQIDLYKQAVAENSPLYNGREYIGYVKRPAGHPFFESDKMEVADLYYDGVLFKNVPILYDLVNDQLIIDDYTKNYRITLISEKVSYFKILGHTFIRPQTDSNSSASIGGFYERIYDGKTTVLVKRRKQLTTFSTSDAMKERYDQYNSYFIKTDDAYSRITSRESLIKAFKKNRGEIRKFLRDYETDFRKDMENIIIKVAEFNDSIKE